MNASTTGLPAEFSAATIIDHYDLTFDGGDKANGSLYLCTPRGSSATRADEFVAQLRAAGLWSDQPPKSVPDEQRQAYKDGLIFLAAIPYAAGREHVVLARFDHPKFPSDSKRWEAWVDCFDVRHERCRCDTPLAGSCLCGAIAFEVRAAPLSMGHCHCSMCRRQHGTAFGTYVEVPRAAFHWTRGADQVKTYVSSPGIARRFCGGCGAKLVFDMDTTPRSLSIAAGAFDSPLPLVPQYHIFVASKAPWHRIHDALPQFDAYPPDDA